MPANNVAGQLVCSLNMTQTFTADTASSGATDRVALGQLPINITSGTGIGQCNEAWSSTFALTASTPLEIDLQDLTGIGGRPVSFTAVKILYITNNDPTVGHDVEVGGAASNAWSAPWDQADNAQTIKASAIKSPSNASVGVPLLAVNLTAAGWAVDATHKVLKFDPGAVNVSGVTIYVAGLSA